MSRKPLDATVRETLAQYFQDLGDQEPSAMHEMMVRTVERPLLDVVMKRAGGNQSKAALWLGLNRNTLRRKLQDHGLL